MADLTETEQEMLEFERSWWKYAGAKEGRIVERFDMQPTTYYATLNALIDRPEALAAEPQIVRRLQRLRDARQRQRSARARGVQLT